MMHNKSRLQIASVLCVQNLVLAERDGASDRQSQLTERGVFRILQDLLSSTDANLFEK